MNRNKKRAAQVFGGFLAVMVLGTVISRAASSALVAQVETGKAGRGRLSYSCEGKGTVVPVEENQIFLWPEQQVEWTAEQGAAIKAGECLVQFRMEYLQQSIEKKQAELTQLELQEAQQRISAKGQARVPAAAGAGRTLAQAQQQLGTAQQKEAEAEAAYEQFLNSAMPMENAAKYEDGGMNGGNAAEYEGGMNGGNEVKSEDSGMNGGNAAKYEDGGMDGGNAAEYEGGGMDSAWLSRKQELEAALMEARAGVEAASQAVRQAQDGYELAGQEDAAQNLNEANAVKAAQLGADVANVQAECARKELERLQSYQAAGGKILADQDCTVLQTGVQAGAVTTGCEILVTGSGGFRLRGQVKAEDREKLKTGIETEIRLGTGKKRTVNIESIGIDNNGSGNTAGDNSGAAGGAGEGLGDTAGADVQGFWTAKLPENAEVQSGDGFTWSIESPSEREYEQIIPLGALKEDVNETYCLVLAEEEQMLGTVQVAKKVPVTVLEKDAKNAAITSGLTGEDRVIMASEKYVTEGDRVRQKE